MTDYTIKLDIADSAMRMCIDSAVHHAISRFSDRLGDDRQDVHRIAHAAAETAVEQFKAWCNGELRLIQIEHEMRAREMMLNPGALVFQGQAK